ncbi:MAG: PIN domain-containing protein [Pseudonocardiaceae bacterium]
MNGGQTTHLVLDAGAFIAWERNDKRVRALVQLAESGEVTLRTSSGVVAQVWRGGSRQARLARLLGSGTVDERPLDPTAARQIGLLAHELGATDVVDGHVASLAMRSGTRVLTSDVKDLRAWGVPTEAIVCC